MEAVGSAWDRRQSDEPRVVVPPTAGGVAAAVSTLAAEHRTASPTATLRTPDRDPPIIAFDAEANSPLASDRRGESVRCTVPPTLEAIFVVAPLAHYVGAGIDVEPDSTPHLAFPASDDTYPLGTMPELQDAVADVLDRLTALDSLLAEREPLPSGVNLDADWARSAAPGERLLAVLTGSEGDSLPADRGWDLAMYVEPTLEHAQVLPHLLQRPCAIFRPEAVALEREELIRRSLEDFYRAHAHPQLDLDLVSPTRQRGRVRGWLADCVAVDGFKAMPSAYGHRLAHRQRETDRQVTVILNEAAMAEEVSTVERIYREGATGLGADVDVRRDLSRSELADALSEPTAFLHYVGHCDEAGLRCADGHLPIRDLDESHVTTFLLNACGSYREGRELVRRGSVAGAVTLRPIVDEQAAKVGIAFAHLVMSGFCIERALRIARRRAIMNKDYVVVGDGTFALESAVRHGGRVEPRDGDRFRLFLEDDGRDELAVTLTRSELRAYLRHAETPIEYEGDRIQASDLNHRLE